MNPLAGDKFPGVRPPSKNKLPFRFKLLGLMLVLLVLA